MGDYDSRDKTLLIRESKFHKSRLLPLHREIAAEIDRYLRARTLRRLPLSADTALIGNAAKGGRAYSGPGLQLCFQSLLKKCSIFTPKGKLPRIHDARHSFAVATLMRWHRNGQDVQALLPALSAQLGHVDPASTYWYLTAVPELLALASQRTQAARKISR
jgi:integrase